MSTFSATVESEAVVDADRMDVWAALTDPDLLPTLTPLLKRITTDGNIWRWQLASISALGVSISPSFTERMTFDEGRHISYTHEPPAGTSERAGAEGDYDLSDTAGGTLLKIRLTLRVDLPLPRSTGPAVSRIMRATMNRTGDAFSANLLKHLGVPRS